MATTPKKDTGPLTVTAVVSVLTLIGCSVAFKEDNISQSLFNWMIWLSIVLGLASIAGYIEAFLRPALGFESLRWIFAASIAFIGYLSRIDAINDINAIFQIDASALPLTAIAGTAMRFSSYMFWPMLAVCGVSALVVAQMIWGTILDDSDELEKVSFGFRAVAAFLASGLAALFIHSQLTDAAIKAKLYRIAHSSDFVSKFNCERIDSEKFDVLFIGPEQRRVLVAPKIPPEDIFFNMRKQPPAILLPVKIPDYFPVMECSPGLPRTPS
jgi:hypothetical protein